MSTGYIKATRPFPFSLVRICSEHYYWNNFWKASGLHEEPAELCRNLNTLYMYMYLPCMHVIVDSEGPSNVYILWHF